MAARTDAAAFRPGDGVTQLVGIATVFGSSRK